MSSGKVTQIKPRAYPLSPLVEVETTDGNKEFPANALELNTTQGGAGPSRTRRRRRNKRTKASNRSTVTKRSNLKRH